MGTCKHCKHKVTLVIALETTPPKELIHGTNFDRRKYVRLLDALIKYVSSPQLTIEEQPRMAAAVLMIFVDFL